MPAYQPGSVTYGAWWPSPALRLQSVGGLAVAAGVLAGVGVLVDWASAATAPAAADELRAAAEAGDVPGLTLHDGVGMLSMLVVPTWIVTALWLQQLRANAATISPHDMRRSAVWSWLGWVVPIVSLWFPRQIVDDSAGVTGRALSVQQGMAARPVPTLAWWLTWLLYSVLGNAAGGVTSSGEARVNPGLELVVAVVGTVALVLWVRVLRGVSHTNDALVRLQAAR